MPTPAKQNSVKSLDGAPEVQTSPFKPVEPRSDGFYLEAERIQSGGLDDDPTDSGDPVKNRRSFTKLKGGR